MNFLKMTKKLEVYTIYFYNCYIFQKITFSWPTMLVCTFSLANILHCLCMKYSHRYSMLALSCLSNFELLRFFVSRQHELINLRHISDHWTTEQIYLFSFDKAFVKFEDCMFCYILRNCLFLGVFCFLTVHLFLCFSIL